METKIRQGMNGKVFETIVLMPEIPNIKEMGREGQAQLKIYTTKTSRGVVQSHAGIEFDMGGGATMSRFPDDFALFVKPKTIIKRATEKGLETVHAETLADFESIKAQAIKHYNA